jgi:tetratricopeptide (TPR) repeat protein
MPTLEERERNILQKISRLLEEQEKLRNSQKTLDIILSHCTSRENNAECMYIAGMIYEKGNNLPVAIEKYQHAVQQHHIPSQVRLLYHQVEPKNKNPLAYIQYAKETISQPQLIDEILAQKDNPQERQKIRLQLTSLLKQQPDYHRPIWHTANALLLQQDYAMAEEIGIALAHATNEPKYWQFIGDVVMQSPYSTRPKSIQWAQQCYNKAT